MNKQTEQEKVFNLFTLLIALFEKFVERIDQDVMQPFLDGDFEFATENLGKIGKNITIDRLMSLLFKNFSDLMTLRINIAKHYGESISRNADVSVELDKKFKKMLKEISKLSNHEDKE